MSVETKPNQEPGNMQTRVVKLLFTVFTCLLACALYFHFFVNTAFVEAKLTVSQQTDLKIYWAEADQPYSEKNMAVAIATPEHKDYRFFLTNIGKIARLRIDTHSYKGEATLKELIVRQEGWAPVTLATAEQFGKLIPLNQIAESRVDNDGIWVLSSGDDPNFELLVTPERQELNMLWLLLRFVAIAGIVSCVLYCASPLAVNLRFVPVLLFGVWVLIVTMAGIGKENSHPEEAVHLAAINYYSLDHWLPPTADDPSIGGSFSRHWVSQLHNGEVSSLFAGKFHKFMQSFSISEYFSARLFNVFLFGLIVLYTIRNRYARMVALPYLISAPLWYGFSVCGPDAFALFFGFLAACELIDPGSLLQRYLKGDGWPAKLVGAVVLGFLLGILFMLKNNFLSFVVFFYLVLIVKLFLTEEFFWDKKAAILRLVIITFLGLSIVGVRVGADYMVNGLDGDENLLRLQEEKTHPWYKPGTELNQIPDSMHQQARGITLQQVIVDEGWFEKIFQSSFGMFDASSIAGAQAYFDLVRWFGAVLLVFLFAAIFRGGGLAGSGLAVAALCVAGGLMALLLYRSWTIDFQAQGLSLFALFPIFGIIYGWNHKVIPQRFLILGVTPMFLLAMYSFIFFGLMRIPRIAF